MEEQKSVSKKPALENKFFEREWHDRLGNDFWQNWYRSARMLEYLDKKFSELDPSICIAYKSQKKFIANGMALLAVLDHDDFLFLPQEMSLLSVARGLSVEQFVGQWNGNLLDPAKGRMSPGSIASEPFHLFPRMGKSVETLYQALGMAMAASFMKHPKIVVFPVRAEELLNSQGMEILSIVAQTKAPLAILVMEGDAELLSETFGIRVANGVEEDIFSTLKKLKNQIDRIRSKQEPCLLFFPNEKFEEQLSQAIEKILVRRKIDIPENFSDALADEMQHGISRARMIPMPPKATVIQDVKKIVPESLEQDWRNWRLAHGK